MESFVEIDGIRMCYRKTGEGRPFILMHGWGCSMDTVASVERVAAETHTVYNIDFPGFGKSAEPDDVWGVERYASFMEKFASEMGISQIGRASCREKSVNRGVVMGGGRVR